MLRLGFTESALLFFYYLNKNHNIKFIHQRFINWLYSTSGFYDKKIKGDYFNFDENECAESDCYNTYMDLILSKMKNYSGKKIICFSEGSNDIPEELQIYKKEFLEYINYEEIPSFCNPEVIFEFIKSKNLLIINNLGELYKQQYQSGNLHIIFGPDYPLIKEIYTYSPGYTFCNNGPDESILESAKRHNIEISKILENNEIDGVVISSGAYSVLLASHIKEKYNKEVFIVGGELSYYFGVITKRMSPGPNDANRNLWATVPENMKPTGYEKIEGGCYW